MLLLLQLAALVALARAPALAGTGCAATVAPGDDVQRALDRLASRTGRAVVCLGAGEFRLRGFLSIVRDRVTLRGVGPATVLRLDEGTESPVVVIGDWERPRPRRPTSEVTIERLRIVGGGSAGGEVVAGRPYLTNSAVVVRAGRDVTIRDAIVTGCRSACIVTERDTRRITIARDDVGGAVWDGIALNRTVDARIVGNTIHDNTAAGISTEHLERSLLRDNVVRDNGTHGLYLSDSYRNTVARNRFDENVLSGVFLTCAVRAGQPAVRCWKGSMSAGNVFERDRFVSNRVGYMVGADPSANCRQRGYAPNRSRGDVFIRTPRQDARATAFGRCVVYAPARRESRIVLASRQTRR